MKKVLIEPKMKQSCKYLRNQLGLFENYFLLLGSDSGIMFGLAEHSIRHKTGPFFGGCLVFIVQL